MTISMVSEAGDEAAFFGLIRELRDLQAVARFTIEGEPVSKARPRFTGRGSKTRVYTPEKTHQAEQAVAREFRRAAPLHQPDSDNTYGVVALFFASTRQRRDVDNMLKLILDGLNEAAWADDDQVVEVSGRKEYVPGLLEHARTEVLVYRVGVVQRPTYTCGQCGKKCPTYASWKHLKRRFCSPRCRGAWLRAARERVCEQCGMKFSAEKTTSSTRFCSRECTDASKRKTVNCTRCGTEFTLQKSHVRVSNYCAPECRDAHARERRAVNAKGNCETCGGPTSKKIYRQCRACRVSGTGIQGKPLITSASSDEPRQ
ncbi:RusA family crossover junction endodeoxyribonuclease [Nonomuraea sp. NPDC001684]